MDPKFDKDKVVIIIGAVLILFGIWFLLSRFFGQFFAVFWWVIGLAIGILSSLLIIGAGVMLFISARQKTGVITKGKRLYRSTSNKKIAGVCGGIAVYLGLQPATVRIIALILGVISWYLVVPLYIIFWAVLPLDEKTYNTWT